MQHCFKFLIAPTLGMLLLPLQVSASSCKPHMIFNNMTSLSGLFFGNDSEGPPGGGTSVQMDVKSHEQGKSIDWDSSTCETYASDPEYWPQYYRNLTNMGFSSNDPIQKDVKCTINDPVLKDTLSMTTTLTQDTSGVYHCEVTRVPDPPPPSNPKIIAAGYGFVTTSMDGIHWNYIDTQHSGITRMILSVAIGKHGNLASSNEALYFSQDGTTWKWLWGSNAGATNVYWDGNQYMLSSPNGLDSPCQNSLICASSDGINWHSVLDDPQDKFRVHQIVKGDENYVAIEYDNWSDNIYTLFSHDGKTWNQSPTDVTCQSVAYGHNTFAIACLGHVLTSSDGGVSWTPRPSRPTYYLGSITYGNNEFVGIGNINGQVPVIVTSPNGIDWTPQTVPTSSPLWAVTWTGSLFVAVGENGVILTSPDGIKWSQQNSGTTNMITCVTSSGVERGQVLTLDTAE